MTREELVIGRGTPGSAFYVVPASWVARSVELTDAMESASTWGELSSALPPHWSEPLEQLLDEVAWDGGPLRPESDVKQLASWLALARPDFIPGTVAQAIGHPLESVREPERTWITELGRLFADGILCIKVKAIDEAKDLLTQAGVGWTEDDDVIDRFLGLGRPGATKAPRETTPYSWGRACIELVWPETTTPAWKRHRRESVVDVPDAMSEWEELEGWSVEESTDAGDSLFEARVLALRSVLEARQDELDWELLAETRDLDADEMTLDDWLVFDEYEDFVHQYLASDSAPVDVDQMPSVAIWIEGTDIEETWPWDPNFVIYWGENAFDYELTQPFDGVVGELSDLADEYGAPDTKTVQKLVKRHRTLPPHRAHVSPSGLIRRRPPWTHS